VPRGLFASGKFDQLKRDIPYSTLAQAFQSLVRSLLSKSVAELANWREALLQALGPNGRLMTDLVTELNLIIGDQPPVPELEPQQAQRRFQLVFSRFIGVFATAEHPLALFLDDLQWLDAATLDLLEDLLTQGDVQHLLLIGAYRDNEVDAAHPLMPKLAAIRSSDAKVSEIKLGPLDHEHIGRLIADALRGELDDAAPLAQLVLAKTAGNPFFVLQFLDALDDEGLLAFDHEAQGWSWDVDRIHAKGYADNVADLMVGKLARLPDEAQKALRQLACLGNVADIATLANVLRSSEEEVHAALWEAVRLELVERLPGAYRFAHDRVQEAAYSLIPEEQRAAAHLRIGRLLAARTPSEKREEAIFDIVNQLNRGAALITSLDEREQLAEFNLIAGKRAKASTAYASALIYLTVGASLLPEDAWKRRHELLFALELNRAQCEFLTGELTASDRRLELLAERATTLVDFAAVTSLRVELFTHLGQLERSVGVALDYMGRLGVTWSLRPSPDEIGREYERMWRQIGDRTIEDLLHLPRMSDSIASRTLEVLVAAVAPAIIFDESIFCLIVGRLANLSLEYGNSDASCYVYVTLGMSLGPYFGDYRAGFRFAKLGLELIEQRGLRQFEARAYLVFGGLVNAWAKHVHTGRSAVQRAFDAAQEHGDLPYAVYARLQLVTNLLAAGDRLSEVQREAENGLAFARKAQFPLVVDIITSQIRLVQTLRGLTPKFGSFDNEQFDELQVERHFSANSNLAMAEAWYWVRKLQARFFADDHVAAVAAAAKAESLLSTSRSYFEFAEYHFYAALARAALCNVAPAAERSSHLEALATHCGQLQEWAENCPENFENRAALVGAEIARLDGREFDAERLYEQAIQSARANGFVHNEALASEVAARFYAAHGLETNAQAHLRNARHCYLRWGADGKVRQLDQLHPHLREAGRASGPTDTIGAPVAHLDLATVIKVSQTVSGEILLERLIDTLMRTAIEQAGAERGLLILPRGVEQRIEAEAATRGDSVIVQLRDEAVAQAQLPESVLHYVLRTRESVILDDAAAQSTFAEDPYIRERQTRSILCLPLINQGKLNGALYLENNLARGVFAPARIAVLKLLASQAATALQNTHLYRDLAGREARIRRLVDSNIIGVCFGDTGRIVEANDAFLRTLGYDRDDFVSGGVSWRDLSPPEWHDRDTQAREQIKTTGTIQPFEKEYFRKDGSRVPVLVGAATLDEGGNQVIAFLLDLTERKAAEDALRESERRFRETQMQLAHANRVATMGQLTASVAHEVNHPIAATRTNAQAGLRWLGAESPNLDEARQALDRIVRDSDRAGAVVQRIRNLSKKATPRDERVELNTAIREVIEITRSEAIKNGVSVQTNLVGGLLLVLGDRVELQQVILNLILNAFEAMSEAREGSRGLLITTSEAESGDALVAVRDSGPGLTPAALENLFKAFHTTKPNGLGLGLSICRSIIEAHGGRLWASANAPRGAVFQFTLPAKPDNAPHS